MEFSVITAGLPLPRAWRGHSQLALTCRRTSRFSITVITPPAWKKRIFFWEQPQTMFSTENSKAAPRMGEQHGTHTKPDSVRKGEAPRNEVFSLMQKRYPSGETYDDSLEAARGYNYRGIWPSIFSVSRCAIWFIVRRKSRNHIPEDAEPANHCFATGDSPRTCSKMGRRGDDHKLCKAQQQAGSRDALACAAALADVRVSFRRLQPGSPGVSRRLVTAILSRKKRAEIADDFHELGPVAPLFPQ